MYHITLVVCEDITKISQQEELIPQNFYDIVIEKGCIDCLLSNPDNSDDKVLTAFKEIKAIMTKTGTFCSFSYAEPEKRIPTISEIFNSTKKIEKISQKFILTKGDTVYQQTSFLNEEDNCYFLYKLKK